MVLSEISLKSQSFEGSQPLGQSPGAKGPLWFRSSKMMRCLSRVNSVASSSN